MVKFEDMHNLRQIIVGFIILITVTGTIIFLYQTYSQRVVLHLFGEQKIGISIGNAPVTVKLADTATEISRGLSNVQSLPENEGMLFIFDKEGNYSFWMKDTLIPLDIIWIDDKFNVVHIEDNVRPESYPLQFSSPKPARFVLEVNAFFVQTFGIKVGDKLSIPANNLPMDLR